MEVHFKETVGLYILFKKNHSELPDGLGRLLIRIEKKLNEELTLAQLQNIEEYYQTLDD